MLRHVHRKLHHGILFDRRLVFDSVSPDYVTFNSIFNKIAILSLPRCHIISVSDHMGVQLQVSNYNFLQEDICTWI